MSAPVKHVRSCGNRGTTMGRAPRLLHNAQNALKGFESNRLIVSVDRER